MEPALAAFLLSYFLVFNDLLASALGAGFPSCQNETSAFGFWNWIAEFLCSIDPETDGFLNVCRAIS